MTDAITHARRLIDDAAEASMRYSAAYRRWTEDAGAVRLIWNDAAGRSMFERFLDPHHTLLDGAAPLFSMAIEGQREALGHAVSAIEEALIADNAAASAIREAADARHQAGTARGEVDMARAETRLAQSEAQIVVGKLNELGSE